MNRLSYCRFIFIFFVFCYMLVLMTKKYFRLIRVTYSLRCTRVSLM